MKKTPFAIAAAALSFSVFYNGLAPKKK